MPELLSLFRNRTVTETITASAWRLWCPCTLEHLELGALCWFSRARTQHCLWTTSTTTDRSISCSRPQMWHKAVVS